eukprot:TRINITY_DN62972_c0_g1_i1.p1 TRINITY_DN62972_c0_g1~~TRINITY_DN62972_c0_g1_i1.p1  ORF type:complete len:328 (-),score=50.13 TRINITY_DN62972_c0_g1_i1:41-1024(-)
MNEWRAPLILLCFVCLAPAVEMQDDPFEQSLTWDLVNGEDKQNLIDGDSIKLTVHCESSWDPRHSIPNGQFRVSLQQEGDKWWKAITKFSTDGTFLNEVVEIADLTGIAKSADIDMNDLESKPQYVLSKAKGLGIHTNIYKIANFADMREHCEYHFDWYHVGSRTQVISAANSSIAPTVGWESVRFPLSPPLPSCDHHGAWVGHGDIVCVHGSCQPLSDVPQDKVRITLQSMDTWWKAVTLWKDNNFQSELVHVQDDKSAVDIALMNASDIPNWQFVLSKAGFLGVHTDVYLIENSNDMKGGCEYHFNWLATSATATVTNMSASILV